MKQLTISYLDSLLCLRSSSVVGPFQARSGFTALTDYDLDLCLDTLKQGHNVVVDCRRDMRDIVAYLMANYRFVKAAGGLVQAPDGSRLLIHREGCWDIPKGLVEAGESLKQAAVREVMEETGLQQVTPGRIITKTYHIYNKYGGWHLKQTTWFGMTTNHKSHTLPQTEEGITQAVWLSPEVCKEHLSQSFASLRLMSQHI